MQLLFTKLIYQTALLQNISLKTHSNVFCVFNMRLWYSSHDGGLILGKLGFQLHF